MIEIIKNALKTAGINRYRINERTESSAELFFVKHELDTRRIKDTHKYTVTVFREETVDGKPMVGSTSFEVQSGMSEGEIANAAKDAYFAASFALNPDFKAPDPIKCDTVKKEGALAALSPEESAGKMAAALFAGDDVKDAFVNSAEVFCHKTYNRILSSEGTDVSFTNAFCTGEFVAQCKTPEDVELHEQFNYDELSPEALTAAVRERLGFVRDRARAQSILKSGKYDLILSGDNLAEVMSYYAEKSNAGMIYPHYSTWKVGDDVQGKTLGEKVDLSLTATVPFSADGIPMKGLKLISDGKLERVWGPTSFCRYLGIEPTGVYGKITCNNEGTKSFEEMKKAPCLWAVVFSDFQMDAMSGHFGGEIRLAYLFDGDKVTPVTGGSVNGSILEAQTDILFSKERYVSLQFDGPYAARFKDISVAGTVAD